MLQAATFCRSRASRELGEETKKKRRNKLCYRSWFVFLDTAREGGEGHSEDEKRG